MPPRLCSLLFVLCCLPACAGPGWVDLFDGTSLTGWKVPEYGGDGEVRVQDGRLVLGAGNSLTGVTWDGPPLPTTHYEIELRAARLAGEDFFVLLTFPVGDGSCSLVLGGWHGEVVGLSSIDGMDADSNPTRRLIEFETGRFYDVRLQVTPAAVSAWLDDTRIIHHPVPGYAFEIRGDVELSRPVGLVTYETESAFERIRWRPLQPRE